MINVHKNTTSAQGIVYVVTEDSEELKAILNYYNIKIPDSCYSKNRLLFWEHELNKIETQWKLARKQERQNNESP